MRIVKHSCLGLFLALLVLLQTACKRPQASFTTDKEEYLAGEVIVLTNTSKDAHSYQWTGPGIINVKTKDAQIQTDGPGVYSIWLTAYSKGAKRSDEMVKNVTVKMASGQVLLYTNSSPLPIQISVDGVPRGSITQSYSTAPDCGAPGCVTLTLDEGEHEFTLTLPNNLSVSLVSKVKAGTCTKMSF